MQEKVFADYDEQIELLRSRGLNIGDPDWAKFILSRTSYYSLINGYRAPFCAKENKDCFIEGASLTELHALYVFDHGLRTISFMQILQIEDQFKAVLSHEFSRKYGHDNYLKFSNFCVRDQKKDPQGILKLFSGIQNELSRNATSNGSVRHYLKNYGYVPFWILVKTLSLGTTTWFYKYLHDDLRNTIAKEFSLQPQTINTLLENLTLFRNVCAHGNRLYCYRTKGPIPLLPIHNFLDIPMNKDGNHRYGKQDYLSLMLILTAFHLDSAYIARSVYGLLSALNKDLSSIPCEKIMRQMGLFDGWEKLSEYSRQSKDKE